MNVPTLHLPAEDSDDTIAQVPSRRTADAPAPDSADDVERTREDSAGDVSG